MQMPRFKQVCEEADTKTEPLPPGAFVLAGKAVFTLTGPAGLHYTYRVNKKAEQGKDPVWFVNLGIGYEDSIYMGMIRKPDAPMQLTGASRVGNEAPSYVLFVEWWQDVRRGLGESRIRFQHEGRCCVCGRPLTNPESIDAGVGPECAGKL